MLFSRLCSHLYPLQHLTQSQQLVAVFDRHSMTLSAFTRLHS